MDRTKPGDGARLATSPGGPEGPGSPEGPGGASPPRVVILGGGFAGLYAARVFRGERVKVTLVDRHNYHLFQPLLYQVATGALSESSVAWPLRTLFRRQRNVETLMATACAVDPAAKTVILDEGVLAYDYLIVATGASFSYFGHDEWATWAPGLKSLDDAIEIRTRIFRAFEAAEREQDDAARAEWLSFVIVGAGPTGVELAGTLAEIARRTLIEDFRHIDPGRTRIVLLDAAPRVLPTYPEGLSDKARDQLCRLGVEVHTGRMVVDVNEHGVRCKGGETMHARTVIWAAGVQATPLARSLDAPLDRQGRVMVQADLTVPAHPEIFVAGDLVHLEQDGELIPGVAPAAIQQGQHAAANICRAMRGEPLEPLRYRHRGMFAIIGRGAAVGEVYGGRQMSGFMAWLAWLFIHFYFIIGFHKRLLVLLQWAYSYLTHRRGARIVTGTDSFGLHAPRDSKGELAAPGAERAGEDEAPERKKRKKSSGDEEEAA